MTLTQLQAVSTTTGAGEVLTQFPINIVIIHTLNAFFYIEGFLGNLLIPVQRRHDDSFFFATRVSTSVHQLM